MVTDSSRSDILAGVVCLPELLCARAKLTSEYIGLADQQVPHDWQGRTWGKFSHDVEQAARQLQIHGCQRGDAIAIMAATSILWDIIQYAIMKNGGIVVGIDTHDTVGNVQIIMESANVKGVITDNPDHLAKINMACRKKLSFILEARATHNLADFRFVVHDDKPGTGKNSASRGWLEINGDDVATIIFTSGTTGKPKGITYTHKQILLACQAVTRTYYDVTDTSKLVCGCRCQICSRE